VPSLVCVWPQVLLRWALARGVAVIPGATSAEHIRENLHLRPFVLSEEDDALLVT
jgi:diketogulonate reductase-like aldo/keto reductase